MNTLEQIHQFARGLVRPVVTVTLVISGILFIRYGVAPPDWFRDLTIMTVTWWFLDRSKQTPTQ